MLIERLRSLREENDLNQEEVALKIKVGRSTYANWEIGRSEPDIKSLITIAQIYKVSLDYLCGNTDIREQYVKDKRKCKYISKMLLVYEEFFK